MARSYSRSFSGGEVTDEFWGQIGDAKFQTGLALCKNFRVLPHGPIQNRAGFEFVREVKDSTKAVRLIPFEYSTDQTMVLEVGEGYVRFHTQGATLLSGASPYEVATTYLASELFAINYVQSADVLTFVHPAHLPAELRRLGALSWIRSDISFVTTLTPPATVSATATVGGTPGTPTLHKYAVTSVASNNIDESLISATCRGVSTTISAITQANPGLITCSAAHGLSVGDPVELFSVLGMTAINAATYTVNTAPSTTTLTLALNGTPVDTTAFVAYVSGGFVVRLGVMNNIFDSGAKNVITWTAATGALRYHVYKQSNGLWGHVGQASGLSFTDDNITPDISKTPPESNDPFSAANEYPGAVTYFEQRRVFGGSTNKPQTLWFTRSGTESNMSYSIPTRDSDSITFRVVARQANTVRHLVPIASLVALTSSAEWRISSGSGDALTPASVDVKPQSAVGAGQVQPVLVNSNVIFAAARGGHMRELAYNWQYQGFITGDLSLRAPHLFDGLEIVDMAFSKSPYPTVWAVSSNGKLLGLTYVPEQQIGAWHQHDTDGLFESICCVAEGVEDVLYAIVRRTINGVSKRYVERMRPRAFATQADCFFVDCGGTYSGTATATITGATWLEGKTISVLADGAVHRQVVVTGGAFTLDYAASKIQFGLPIIADGMGLPLTIDAPGYGQGQFKAINRVLLRVKDTSGLRVGPAFDKLSEMKTRTDEAYGMPPSLQSRVVEVVNKSAWTDDGQVCFRQQDPLPATISSIKVEYVLGG
jgi:hypothetical protein